MTNKMRESKAILSHWSVLNKMKIFLSWSGSESKQLASIFKEWLPNVLQFVEPYMSAKDISLGERWNNNITGNLHDSYFGLIFVTPSNINAPWINYEAGALSKTLDAKVVPILYKSDVLILNDGPLKQFQSAKNLEEDSILSLLKSINNSNKDGKLDDSRLEKAFEMWWTHLEEAIALIEEETTNDDTNQNEPSEKQLLNVIFSKLTEQEKLLKRSNRVNRNNNNIYFNPVLLKDLDKALGVLLFCKNEFDTGPYSESILNLVDEGIVRLEHAMNYLENKNNFNDEASEVSIKI